MYRLVCIILSLILNLLNTKSSLKALLTKLGTLVCIVWLVHKEVNDITSFISQTEAIAMDVTVSLLLCCH